jgi:hypothetical protein
VFAKEDYCPEDLVDSFVASDSFNWPGLFIVGVKLVWWLGVPIVNFELCDGAKSSGNLEHGELPKAAGSTNNR